MLESANSAPERAAEQRVDHLAAAAIRHLHDVDALDCFSFSMK